MLDFGKPDIFEFEMRHIRGRNWFNFGETVSGDIVINLRKARKVGKVTARLRCIQNVRLPLNTGSSNSRFHVHTVEHYCSSEYSVAGLDGHRMAAQQHRFPVSFTLPSYNETLPSNYDSWCKIGGRDEWCGAKWFMELRVSNSSPDCKKSPIVVFPKGSYISYKLENYRFTQKEHYFILPSSLASLQKAVYSKLDVKREDQCKVGMTMNSTPNIYAGQLPEITLAIHSGTSRVLVLYRVTISLCNRVKATLSNSSATSGNATVLSEWYPYYVPLLGMHDLTNDYRAHLRDQGIWECEQVTDTTSVTHFLEFSVFVASSFDRTISQKFSLTCPIILAAPVEAEADTEEALPSYPG